MNILSLISLWLDISYQITTKYATISKSKSFRELNTVWKTNAMIKKRKTNAATALTLSRCNEPLVVSLETRMLKLEHRHLFFLLEHDNRAITTQKGNIPDSWDQLCMYCP